MIQNDQELIVTRERIAYFLDLLLGCGSAADLKNLRSCPVGIGRSRTHAKRHVDLPDRSRPAQKAG